MARITHDHSTPRGDRESGHHRRHPHRALARPGGPAHQHGRAPLGHLGTAAPERVRPVEARSAKDPGSWPEARAEARGLRPGRVTDMSVSLLFHDVYTSDPRESGFASAAADRYKLSVAAFDAQLEGLASVRDRPFVITVDDGGVSYYTLLADRLDARGWRG